jgi:hypothetical protein
VELKAAKASVMSAFGKHWVRVKWCSLWPRRKDCAQECVRQTGQRQPEVRAMRTTVLT